MELNEIVSYTVIISFAAAVVQYVVIRPLQASISSLGEAVSALRTLLQDIECRLNTETRNLDTRIVCVEESTKSAHKRIDALEGEIHGFN